MRRRTPALQAPHLQPLYGAGADAQGKNLLFYGAERTACLRCRGGCAGQGPAVLRRHTHSLFTAPRTHSLVYGAGAGAQGKDLLFYGASIFENWRGTAVGVTWANSAGIVEDYNNTFPNRYNCNVLACSGAHGAGRTTRSSPRTPSPCACQAAHLTQTDLQLKLNAPHE